MRVNACLAGGCTRADENKPKNMSPQISRYTNMGDIEVRVLRAVHQGSVGFFTSNCGQLSPLQIETEIEVFRLPLAL